MTARLARIGAIALLLVATGCEHPDHVHRSRTDRTSWVGAEARPFSARTGRDPFWGRPILVEHFRGNRVDPRRWTVYHAPRAREHPRSRHAVRVRGGALRLTGGIRGGRDVSGGVASTIAQRYGRWEVRMRAGRGSGYSAVALLWPERMGDPEYAEINFAEIVDPSRRTHSMFVHYGPRDITIQRQVAADFTRWRTVAVDWLPGRLTMWLDGRRVWTYRGRLVPRRGRMGLTLQNDVVCTKESCRNAATPRKVTMYVDRVRIYRAPG